MFELRERYRDLLERGCGRKDLPWDVLDGLLAQRKSFLDRLGLTGGDSDMAIPELAMICAIAGAVNILKPLQEALDRERKRAAEVAAMNAPKDAKKTTKEQAAA